MKRLSVWLSTKDLPEGWIVNRFNDLWEIQCIKLQRQQMHTPIVILHLLLIHSDLTWEVHTINDLVSNNCNVLKQYPSVLTAETVLSLIHLMDLSFVEVTLTNVSLILPKANSQQLLEVVLPPLKTGLILIKMVKNFIVLFAMLTVKSYHLLRYVLYAPVIVIHWGRYIEWNIWNGIIFLIVYSFCEIAKFLLSQSDNGYILSERFNQDPIEGFFGQQCSRDKRNDNPSVQQFLYNTQAIIVQKSMVSGSSSSITKKWSNPELSPLCRPLPKRKCVRKIV